jgi:hypothetical protein
MPEVPLLPTDTLEIRGAKVSSYCTYGNCVEVGESADGSIVVRNNTDVSRRVAVVFTRREWADFVLGVKAGEFDYR